MDEITNELTNQVIKDSNDTVDFLTVFFTTFADMSAKEYLPIALSLTAIILSGLAVYMSHFRKTVSGYLAYECLDVCPHPLEGYLCTLKVTVVNTGNQIISLNYADFMVTYPSNDDKEPIQFRRHAFRKKLGESLLSGEVKTITFEVPVNPNQCSGNETEEDAFLSFGQSYWQVKLIGYPATGFQQLNEYLSFRRSTVKPFGGTIGNGRYVDGLGYINLKHLKIFDAQMPEGFPYGLDEEKKSYVPDR
ncbi:hypothetical protein AAFX24_27610 [Vibrio mediterranei]|uniref:hypothetical protein n=1 Tax=Vibrio mediterranei TaxID=689 RepID=UPI0038CF2014